MRRRQRFGTSTMDVWHATRIAVGLPRRTFGSLHSENSRSRFIFEKNFCGRHFARSSLHECGVSDWVHRHFHQLLESGISRHALTDLCPKDRCASVRRNFLKSARRDFCNVVHPRHPVARSGKRTFLWSVVGPPSARPRRFIAVPCRLIQGPGILF